MKEVVFNVWLATGTDQCLNLSGACQLACQGSQVQACRCTNGYPDVICMSPNNNNSGANSVVASFTAIVGTLVLSYAAFNL